MRTFVVLPNVHEESFPVGFDGPDVRFAPALARRLLAEFTQAGDVVFDPFAGFGTTLRVAEAMGRVAYGIEWDERRAAYIRSRLERPQNLIHGDSRRLAEYPGIPPFDFSLTSPPYMRRGDVEDPLTNYTVEGQGYDTYLTDLRAVYAQVAARMRPGATVVIEASNLNRGAANGGVTMLAWDIAAVVSEVLTFAGEIVVGWEGGYGFGYDHSYCLVFRR